MKKRIVKLFVLFIFFVLSAIFSILNSQKEKIKPHKILEVKRADMFYVDLNDNGIKEDNELVKLKDIYAFSDEYGGFSKNALKRLGLSKEEFLKAGFLAQNWAKDNLEGEVVYLFDVSYDEEKYIRARASIDEVGDLAEFYLQGGLAYVSSNAQNPFYYALEDIYQIRKNAQILQKLDFIFINPKSKIYHSPDCEFAKLASNLKIVLAKNFDKTGYKPCRACQVENRKYLNLEYEIPKNQHDYSKISNKTFSNVELYLINPLVYDMPQRSAKSEVSRKLIDEINKAQSSIDIALYGFGEAPEIYKALRNAKNKGVKIRAIADYSKKMDEIYSLTKSFIEEFDAKTDKTENIMHNKFFIFDDKKVMSGSVNISSSGIGGYSANVAVFINSEAIAKIYKQEFEQMYQGNFSRKKKKFEHDSINGISIYFSPEDNPKEAILEKIKEAKSEICTSVFYLTDLDIISSLIDAKARGVRVYVLLDAVFANSFKDRIETLREAKIPTIVENWGGKNHEKTIEIDGETLIIGSCNFTKAGFLKNDENVLIIQNKDIASYYRDYYFYLFNSIEREYLYKIPRAEGFESKNSCHDKIDNDFDGKTDFEDEDCKYKN